MADETKTDFTTGKTDKKDDTAGKPLTATEINRLNMSKSSLPAVSSKSPVVKDEASELHTKIQEILKEHGGIESNIPHNHHYWTLMNHYRTLINRRKV